MRNPTFLALAALFLLLPFTTASDAAAPGEAQTRYQEGLASLEEGRYEDAVASLEKFIAEAPEGDAALPLAHLNLGTAYASLGQSDKAIASFQAAIAAAPDLAIAHLYLGTSYRLKDDYGAALPALVKALQLDPTISRAHDELWQTYGSIGTRFGYDRELIVRQIYHMERVVEKEPDYIKMFPDFNKELDILFGLLKRLEEVQPPTSGRVFRKKHELRPGMTAEKTVAELPPAPALPDDGIPPAEKTAALEKAKAR